MIIKRSLSATPSQHGSASFSPSTDGDHALPTAVNANTFSSSGKIGPSAAERSKASETGDNYRKSSCPTPKKTKKRNPTGSVTTDWTAIEGWTAEQREAFITRIISAGTAAVGTAALADEVSLPSLFQVVVEGAADVSPK